MGIVGFYLMSCSSNKSISTTNVKDYYANNPFAQPYLNYPGIIPADFAKVCIQYFKKHKYRDFGKKRLENTLAAFDRSLLTAFANDSNVDSIYFYLAAYPKWYKAIDKSKARHPFVIIEAKPKVVPPVSGKGSAESLPAASQSIFAAPVKLCPPPDRGCRIPGGL